MEIFMNKVGINIAVLGKSGVGKSSFCNYIFNDQLNATGNGKPVTDWNEHFKYKTVEHNNYVLNIFDSVGIEPDNYSKWKQYLDDFLSKRDFRFQDDFSQWIHGAFYLLNANSARIEEVEKEIITCLKENNIPIVIVLTNADCDDDKKEGLKEQIRKIDPKLMITEVCSVEIRKRLGSTKQFGKNKTIELFVDNLADNLKNKMAVTACDMFNDMQIKTFNKVINTIEKSELGFFKLIKEAIKDNNFNFEEIFNINVDGDIQEVQDFFIEKKEALNKFILDIGMDDKIFIDSEMYGLEYDFENEINNATREIEGKLDSITSELESSEFSKIVSGIFKVAKVLFNMKGFIIGEIELMKLRMTSFLEDKRKLYMSNVMEK